MLKKMGKLISFTLVFSMLATFFAGCKKEDTDIKSTTKNQAMTSFYVMEDFTKKLTENTDWEVDIMVPEGMEVHEWDDPPVKKIQSLQNSKIFVYNGLGMEPWIDKVSDAVDDDSIIMVDTSANIKGAEGKSNPHVWLNPLFAKEQMEAIKNALVETDPENTETFNQNYEKYAKKFDELDAEYKEAAKNFKTKDIVVAHGAYDYLCDAYGLNQIELEGSFAISDPSPADMAEIKKYIEDNNITHIFFESLSGSKSAEAIANETGIDVMVLESVEGPGEEGDGADYFSLMEKNLENLKKVLS